MGFFNLFRKKQEKIQKELEENLSAENIKITMIRTWFDDNFNEKVKDAKSKGKKLYNEIIEYFSTINSLLDILMATDFEKHDKTYAIVNMTKDTFVKRSKNILNLLPATESEVNYSFLNGFYFKSMDLIDKLKNIEPKQAIFLSRYFKNETKNIIEQIKKIESHLIDFKEFLENDAKFLKLNNELEKKLMNIFSCKSKLEELKNRSEGLDIELEKAKLFNKEIKDSHNKLLDSDEFRAYESLKTASINIEKNIKNIKNEVENIFSKVQRPLKKLAYIKPEKILDEVIASPFSVLLQNDNKVKDFFEQIITFSKERKISLKPTDEAKVLKLINNFESIKKLIEKYKSLDIEKWKIEKELSKLDITKKQKDINEKLNRNIKRIEQIEAEIKNIDVEKNQVEANMKSLKEAVEKDFLENINRKVIIEL